MIGLASDAATQQVVHDLDRLSQRFTRFRERLDLHGQAVYDRVQDYARMYAATAASVSWDDAFQPLVLSVLMAIEREMAGQERRLVDLLGRIEDHEREHHAV